MYFIEITYDQKDYGRIKLDAKTSWKTLQLTELSGVEYNEPWYMTRILWQIVVTERTLIDSWTHVYKDKITGIEVTRHHPKHHHLVWFVLEWLYPHEQQLNKLYNKSTNSPQYLEVPRFFLILYRSLYDLLFKKSTINRSSGSGIWAVYSKCLRIFE